MIRYQKDMATTENPNMRGGEGITKMTSLFLEHIPHMRILSVITLEPGCSIGTHLHQDEAEAYYILEGEATVLDAGENVKLRAGDAHLCRSGESHGVRNDGPATMRMLAIIPTVAE